MPDDGDLVVELPPMDKLEPITAPGVLYTNNGTENPPAAYTSFVDTSVMTPDVKRELVISGGFSNGRATKNDPKAFTYEFADNAFPNIPLIQPRLNSVEEWVPSPSTVVTSRPSARKAGVMQLCTGLPSSHTVQAPQSPASQPFLTPW